MIKRLTDIRSLLSNPWIYNLFQMMMRAKHERSIFVKEYVRPSHGDTVLDVGCGTAQLLSLFPEDVSYVGYDPCGDYISHAQNVFAGRGKFYKGFFDQKAAKRHDPFDLVILSSVLHHMNDDQVAELMNLIYQTLASGGRLVTFDPVLCTPQNPVARLLINLDRGQFVRTSEEYLGLVSQIFTEIKGIVRHIVWIPYSQWIMECKKPITARKI